MHHEREIRTACEYFTTPVSLGTGDAVSNSVSARSHSHTMDPSRLALVSERIILPPIWRVTINLEFRCAVNGSLKQGLMTPFTAINCFCSTPSIAFAAPARN